ncbi:hypothetical protein COEX109129_12135 [Corallococcus exiguus]
MSVTEVALVVVPVTVTVAVFTEVPLPGVLMATVGTVRSTVKVEVAVVLVLPAASVDTAVTVFGPSGRVTGSA